MTSQLRTVQSDGLILYSGDVSGVPGHDFMAIELVGGRVQYAFDLGGGSRVLPDSGQRLVNDGLWHTVYVSRPTVDRHTLRVMHLRCNFFSSFLRLFSVFMFTIIYFYRLYSFLSFFLSLSTFFYFPPLSVFFTYLPINQSIVLLFTYVYFIVFSVIQYFVLFCVI